ncbi:MAG: glycoside hydrolase family 38 N-terminal domain-containing protein [Planctomycetota bacterium]
MHGLVIGQSNTNAGQVAILVEPGMVEYGGKPVLSLDSVSGILNRAGLEAKAINAGELADPKEFNIDKYAVLVMLYSNAFPLPALPNIQAFRRQGGSLVMNGIPFCHPCEKDVVWIDKGHVEYFGHDSKGVGTGGFEGPNAQDAPLSSNENNPLKLKDFMLADKSGTFQWLRVQSLDDKDKVFPLFELELPGRKVPVAALIRHGCDQFHGASDVWMGQVAMDSNFKDRYLAEQFLTRGVAWCLMKKDMLSESDFRNLLERMDTTSTTVVESIEIPEVLLEKDGELLRLVHLKVHRMAQTQTRIAVHISGMDTTEDVLSKGTNLIEIPLSRSTRSEDIVVTVEAAGRTIARHSEKLEPVRKWEVYFLPHSHVDIGYTHIQNEVEHMQWQFFEQAIELARQTADYPAEARFKWNVEVLWAVEGYLRQASAEKKEEFIEAIRKGWIGLDALYGSELTGLCRPEELFELTGFARRLAQRYGLKINSAMITDVPGYTWGLVPALAHSGVKYFSPGPNHIPHLPHQGDRIGYTLETWGDRPFYWISPSKQKKLLVWMPGHGYSWFHGWIMGSIKKAGPRPILGYLKQLKDSGYPYDMVQLRYTISGDNGPPDPDLPEFIKNWNSKYAYPKMIIETTSRMFEQFERRYGNNIPTVSGDFTPYWEDGAASSARETAINRNTTERLIQAQTLWAMLDPQNYPVADFNKAWRNVVLYDEHTWGANNSISAPDGEFAQGLWKIKQARALDADAQSRELLKDALAGYQGRTSNIKAVDVYNTTSWVRNDLVILPGDWTLIGELVKDTDGDIVPAQRLSSGELAFVARDVPPLGARRFIFHAGPPTKLGRTRAEGMKLTNSSLAVIVDEITGAINQLKCVTVSDNLVKNEGDGGLNNYFYVPGLDQKDARRNGKVNITVKESGPLVASLLIQSDAPGCNSLAREIRIVEGLDYVDIINTIDRKRIRTKEGVHFGFAFNVPEGVMRIDTPWAVVQPELDQIPGANKNYFCVGRWVDISNQDYGVTWAPVDAPLMEIGGMTAEDWHLDPSRPWIKELVPSQTIYSYVMNNYWHTNYKADQEGITVFRYSIRPHRTYSQTAAQHFGIERSQPLIAVPTNKNAPIRSSLLQVEPDGIIVTSFKPSMDGKAWMVRLFNTGQRPQKARLVWAKPQSRSFWLSNPAEDKMARIDGPIEMAAYEIVTLRCQLQKRD